MQRLRSPFRLRPGPGAEQRKGKGRRGGQQEAGQGGEDVTQRSGEDATAGDADARQRVTGAESVGDDGTRAAESRRKTPPE